MVLQEAGRDVMTGLNRITVGLSGKPLWTRQWIFGHNKRREICWSTERFSSSQEILCLMEWVISPQQLLLYLKLISTNDRDGRPPYNKLPPERKHSGQPHTEPKINQQTNKIIRQTTCTATAEHT
jgi:hypothetical protein